VGNGEGKWPIEKKSGEMNGRKKYKSGGEEQQISLLTKVTHIKKKRK